MRIVKSLGDSPVLSIFIKDQLKKNYKLFADKVAQEMLHIDPTVLKFIAKYEKYFTPKPLMRAMSTVDHKRIRVMYLLFRLFARIMRV